MNQHNGQRPGAMRIPGTKGTIGRGPATTNLVCPECGASVCGLPPGKVVATRGVSWTDMVRVTCSSCGHGLQVPVADEE